MDLLRAFRLSVMRFSELDRVHDALQGKSVSLENEYRAYRSILQALTAALKSFPTTLEEDVAILATPAISVNLRHAVILRKTQKELLTNNIDTIGKMWANILLRGELFGAPLQ